jgi:Dual OB-containing domain
MGYVEIVCLANSYKMGGRCIAGLRLDGGGWVRPVAADTDHGQLYRRHWMLNDRSEPEVLDVIRIDLSAPRPIPGQPENWALGKNPWILTSRGCEPALCDTLRTAIVPGPFLLGSSTGQTTERYAARLTDSLALIRPANLKWHLSRDIYGRPQPRLRFELRNQRYNLPVTDPAWITRIVRTLHESQASEQTQEAFGIAKDATVLLTISLAEPLKGVCYKLVAGIIVMPASPP